MKSSHVKTLHVCFDNGFTDTITFLLQQLTEHIIKEHEYCYFFIPSKHTQREQF